MQTKYPKMSEIWTAQQTLRYFTLKLESKEGKLNNHKKLPFIQSSDLKLSKHVGTTTPTGVNDQALSFSRMKKIVMVIRNGYCGERGRRKSKGWDRFWKMGSGRREKEIKEKLREEEVDVWGEVPPLVLSCGRFLYAKGKLEGKIITVGWKMGRLQVCGAKSMANNVTRGGMG